MVNIDGTSCTTEVVVVLFGGEIKTGAESMSADILGQLVAQVIAVLNKSRRCGGALRGAPEILVEVVSLNLNPRNTEVHVLTGVDLVEIEASKIDAKLVDHGRGKCVDKGNRLDLVERLNI